MLSRLGKGRIFLAAGATDMRKSFNGLSGLVRSRLAGDPLSGDLFVFCNRSKNRLKLLFLDSTGLWRSARGCSSVRSGGPRIAALIPSVYGRRRCGTVNGRSDLWV